MNTLLSEITLTDVVLAEIGTILLLLLIIWVGSKIFKW